MRLEQKGERSGLNEKPLVESAVYLFTTLLLKKGFNLQDLPVEFTSLGERLLKHARHFKEPINRDAFLQAGPQVIIIDKLGGGDGPVLGWTFDGEIQTEDGRIKVTVEKTDRFNGKGVTLSMHIKQDRNRLSIWTSEDKQGLMTYGVVNVELNKNGETQDLQLVRQPYLFRKGPLELS